MTNKELKTLIISQTGMDSNDYDKIMDYLNDKGIKINLPDKIGFLDVEDTIKKQVEPVANQQVKSTQYDKALAEEIGVKDESVARFTAYASNIGDALEGFKKIPIVGGQVEDAIKDAGLEKFTGSQNQIGKNLCKEFGVSLEKDTATVEHTTPQANNPAEVKSEYAFADKEKGVFLKETDNGFGIYVENNGEVKQVGGIVVADQHKAEFVSEFAEKVEDLDNGNSLLFRLKVLKAADNVMDEIKEENDFSNVLQDVAGKALTLKEKSLLESIEKIDASLEKLDDGVMKNMLTKVRDSLNSQLEDVQNSLEKLDAAEVEKAKEWKEQFTNIKNDLEATIAQYDEKIETANGLVRSVLEMQREAFLDKLDEANDRIVACENRINGATTTEQVEVEKKAALENINNITGKITEGVTNAANMVKDVVEDAANDVKAGATTFVVNFDNLVSDLKDLWGKVQNFAEDTTAKVAVGAATVVDAVATNEHVVATGKAAAELGRDSIDNLGEIGKEAKDLVDDVKGAKNIKDVGNALGEFYNDIQDDLKEIGKEAKEFGKDMAQVAGNVVEDIKESAKDAAEWAKDKAEDIKEAAEDKWNDLKEGIANFFDRDD